MFINTKLFYACIVFSVRVVSHRRAVSHIFVWGRIPHAADPGPPTEGPGHHLGSAQLSSAQLGPPAEAGSAPELLSRARMWPSLAQPGSARFSPAQLGPASEAKRPAQQSSAGCRLVQPGSAWPSLAQLGLLPGSIALAPWGGPRRRPAQLGSGWFSSAQLRSVWPMARRDGVDATPLCQAQTGTAWFSCAQLRSARPRPARRAPRHALWAWPSFGPARPRLAQLSSARLSEDYLDPRALWILSPRLCRSRAAHHVPETESFAWENPGSAWLSFAQLGSARRGVAPRAPPRNFDWLSLAQLSSNGARRRPKLDSNLRRRAPEAV